MPHETQQTSGVASCKPCFSQHERFTGEGGGGGGRRRGVIQATFAGKSLAHRLALSAGCIRIAQSRISGHLATNRAPGPQARPEAPKAG